MSPYNVIDVFDLLVDKDTEEEKLRKKSQKKAVDELLVESKNKFGAVDMTYIAENSGLEIEDVVKLLKGSVYQLPEVFVNSDSYDISKGWVVSSRYFSGNIVRKLELAKEMNRKFRGRFDSNVKALQKVAPLPIDIEDINLGIGAPFIPVEEYQQFVKEFLDLRYPVKIQYIKELGKYKVTETDESKKSILNTMTYGVRDDSMRRTNGQYMTALDIIESSLNTKPAKIYDYTYKSGAFFYNYAYEPILNKAKTMEAQEKQKAIEDAFKDWVYADRNRRLRFEEYYNDSLVGYAFSVYDGDFLTFPDLNPDVKFYKHQRDAIARALLSDSNVLFAHDVGTGKTYEMIATVHELYRMGLSSKNMVVVPNNVLKATVNAHKHLYKDDEILVVYPKDFTPKKRDEVLCDIRDNDYVAVYMAYSSFDMITMSKQYYCDQMSDEIAKLRDAAAKATDKYEQRTLSVQADRLAGKLFRYIEEEIQTPWLTFEELGIETLVVDEAHNYKNIPIKTQCDNIVGMSRTGSKKCKEMLEKAHYVKRLVFATGTPLTNSISDLYALQLYLQPEVLEYHKIDRFDAWINTFSKKESFIECDVDANSTSLRTMTRFSSFHNLGELMALFAQVCDFHHIDADAEGLPEFESAQDVCVEKSTAQAEYVAQLSKRADLIRSKQVSRTKDNLLKVTTDGRKAALDMHMVEDVDISLIDTRTKVEVCADKILEFYNKYPDTVQIVFSDIGTPKPGFNVYDSLRQTLVSMGIPYNEIVFAHDAATERQRAKLFKEINNGTIRVVIGSTQKLGVGVNIQERLIALHHLSVPWRPADMVQREGRILRKGNTCEKVHILRYITEGTFDSYSWQLLENKQRFISSFLGGTCGLREMDDIADAVLNYAEVKALAIGNPLIKKRVEVANLLERAKISSRSRQRQLQELKAVADSAPSKITRLTELSEIARADFKAYESDKMSISNDERIAFGEELLDALKYNADKSEERLFDVYQGFSVMLPAHMDSEHPYIYVKSERGGAYYCEIALDKTPMGCSKTIDYLLEHLNERADKTDRQIEQTKQQLKEALTDLDKGNMYTDEIERLTMELSDIDTELNDIAQEEAA